MLQLPKDHVEGAHLGLERFHQLGTDEDRVLVRSVLSHQGHSGLCHVVAVQPGGQVSVIISIHRQNQPKVLKVLGGQYIHGKMFSLTRIREIKVAATEKVN